MPKTLSQLREEKGVNQRTVAKALGLSPGAIGNYEAGKRIPRYPVLKRLAEYYGVSIADLIVGPDAHSSATKG